MWALYCTSLLLLYNDNDRFADSLENSILLIHIVKLPKTDLDQTPPHSLRANKIIPRPPPPPTAGEKFKVPDPRMRCDATNVTMQSKAR